MYERPIGSITIEKELKNGNTGRTKHWSSAARERKAWMVAEAHDSSPTLSQDVREVNERGKRVGIRITRVLGKRQRFWDADSILRGSAKELLDSVVELGYIADDSFKYVAWVHGEQAKSADGIGKTIVEFFEE